MLIEENTIHLWQIDLAALGSQLTGFVEQCRGLLSEAEQQRAEKFATPVLQQRYILSHAALRDILAGYLGVEAPELQFESQAAGKPHLSARLYGCVPLQFNLSHSRGCAMLSVCLNAEIGVDAEAISREIDSLAIAKRYFAPSEYQALQQAPVAELNQRFVRLWTAKEAFVKGVGHGIGYDLSSFQVDLADPCQPKLKSHREQAPWQLQSVAAPEGYFATMAHQLQAPRVEYFGWTEINSI